MIVKYVESAHNGIQSQTLARYAIGCVLRGTKHIYDGDKRQVLNRGDVFYMGVGRHYVEHVPDGSQPFEQILFYYTPAVAGCFFRFHGQLSPYPLSRFRLSSQSPR